LWLYLADQNAKDSIRPSILNGDKSLSLLAQQRIASPVVRPDAWSSYFSGLVNAQSRYTSASLQYLTHTFKPHGLSASLQESLQLATGDNSGRTSSTGVTAEYTAALQDILMYGSGLPGQIAFNPLFTKEKKVQLDQFFAREEGPTTFTNATRASDLEEIYLYSGAEPDKEQHTSMTGHKAKRKVLRMTPEFFFASGARPPYIAPMPVTVEGKTEHWMEGAMRCNPPLVPLIDMEATHILLIRFFSKDCREEPNNNSELNERFLDAIFNIPLQKEIESIELNNNIARTLRMLPDDAPIEDRLRNRREVTVLDPADGSNHAASPHFIKFLNEELNALSHFDANIPARRAQMFDRGFQIGKLLIQDLQKHLPSAEAEVAADVPAADAPAAKVLAAEAGSKVIA
jgi:predicted acylesterase/phospholipase RssA